MNETTNPRSLKKLVLNTKTIARLSTSDAISRTDGVTTTDNEWTCYSQGSDCCKAC